MPIEAGSPHAFPASSNQGVIRQNARFCGSYPTWIEKPRSRLQATMSAAKRLHRLHWLLMERNPRSNTSTSRSCKNVAARRLETVIPKQRRAYTGEGVT